MKLLFRSTIALMAVSALFGTSIGSCSKSKGSTDTTERRPTPPPPPPVGTADVTLWLTKGDRSALLEQQTTVLSFGTVANNNSVIDVDSVQAYQTIDGFGYTLTQGSAYVLNGMTAANRTALINELFGNSSTSIGVSYLRLGIGATDLSTSVYSYDDMPKGQTDPTLANFSIARDLEDVVPVLKQILAVNAGIKILATPWSAPAWMKDNDTTRGGSLKPEYYDAYARYFVKYLQAMQAQGIVIDAITPQNEPLNPFNNPSMLMTAAQQATFIKSHLGPTLRAAGFNTKIIAYDHNADRPDYPLEVLGDAAARAYVDGSAFHLYGGDISALSQVRNAYPDKNIYFTEQYTASNGSFAGDLKWHLKNVLIGATRNWSKTVLEWNLANDPNIGPYIAGTCNSCLGAVTIGSGVTRNVAYYIIAHASKFVPAGSVRIASSPNSGSLYNVAFKRPDGKKVLIVLNDGQSAQTFNLKFKDKWTVTTLPAESVGTYIW